MRSVRGCLAVSRSLDEGLTSRSTEIPAPGRLAGGLSIPVSFATCELRGAGSVNIILRGLTRACRVRAKLGTRARFFRSAPPVTLVV